MKYLVFGLGLILLLGGHLSLQAAESTTKAGTSQIGGYGELHYNYSQKDNGATTSQLDFHRFILFVGYYFTEKWSFWSELELEHNFVQGGQGELELEQAFVQYRHSPAVNFTGGVVLPRVGLINQIHEPPTFLSVERPLYANKLIPTTWFGNGVTFYGSLSGLEYSLVIMEGLDGTKISPAAGIRSSRGKGSISLFRDNARYLTYNGALDFTGINGLKVGTSVSYNNSYAGTNTGGDVNIPLILTEVHVQFKKSGFWVTAEAGYISYNNKSVLDLMSSFAYYAELAYDLGYLFNWEASLYPFLRWSHVDTSYQTWSGTDNAQKTQQWMAGISWLPLPQVSLKLEYAQETKGSTATTLISYFNACVGYQF